MDGRGGLQHLGSTKKEWVDSAYSLFHKPGPKVPWSEVVWQKYNVPMVQMISWLASQGRLLTKDQLRRFVPQVDPTCILCGEEGESHSHLFLILPVFCLKAGVAEDYPDDGDAK